MKKTEFKLVIRSSEPLHTSTTAIAEAVERRLLQPATVECTRIRQRDTLVKYADPESMHLIEPNAEETWTERTKRVSAAAKAIRATGNSVRVVKITADGFFAWLNGGRNTEESRKEYADWLAEHRTRSITDARKIASRENGKRGGRPRKHLDKNGGGDIL